LLFYGVPVVNSFNPAHGLVGTNVTILGTNFTGATAVNFIGASASILSNNGGQIVTVVPAAAQTGPISVTAPAGTGTSGGSFVLDTSDLGLTVAAAPNPVTVGSNLVYTLVITNAGPYAAPNVRLTNTLPAQVVFKNGAATQGSLGTNGNVVTGSLGSLAAAGSATLTLTVAAPPSPGLITNTAVVAADDGDPSPTNNTVVTTTYVQSLALLSIRLATNLVLVSWPWDLTNYSLQFKSALTTNFTWSNVTTAPVISSNRNVVTETNSHPERFYRLEK
jgi:uncharacterized repeat protein (TIGR01451 family)